MIRNPDLLRQLERSQLRFQEVGQCVGRHALARVAKDNSADNFAQPLVGQTKDARFGNGWMLVDFGLDFLAGYILAATDDDVLLAVHNEEIIVGIEVADVACSEISV